MENGKLDILDRKIIRELLEDGRRPTRQIARKLGVTDATVTSRITALRQSGVMRVIAQRNVSKLKNRLACLIEVWVQSADLETVANEISRIGAVASLLIAAGSPEIHVTAFVEENAGVLALLQNEIGQIPGISRLEVNLGLQVQTYRSDLASLSKSITHTESFGDALDDQILAQLQIDGRSSNREIARTLGLPASTVRERINRMLQSNAIRIGAVCEPGKVGINMVAYAYLLVDASSINAALEHLSSAEDMGQVTSTTGRFNIFVLFGARDFPHILEIVKEKLESTPGLQDISLRIVAEVRKHQADLIQIVEP